MQIAAREIVLWTTPSEPPKALQASECSELLDPMRASCLILAQHQPGKFSVGGLQGRLQPDKKWQKVLVLLNNPAHNKKTSNEERCKVRLERERAKQEGEPGQHKAPLAKKLFTQSK